VRRRISGTPTESLTGASRICRSSKRCRAQTVFFLVCFWSNSATAQEKQTRHTRFGVWRSRNVGVHQLRPPKRERQGQPQHTTINGFPSVTKVRRSKQPTATLFHRTSDVVAGLKGAQKALFSVFLFIFAILAVFISIGNKCREGVREPPPQRRKNVEKRRTNAPLKRLSAHAKYLRVQKVREGGQEDSEERGRTKIELTEEEPDQPANHTQHNSNNSNNSKKKRREKKQ
jgi:hypothetical protein